MTTDPAWVRAHNRGVCGIECPLCATEPDPDIVTIPAAELARLRAVEGAANGLLPDAQTAHGPGYPTRPPYDVVVKGLAWRALYEAMDGTAPPGWGVRVDVTEECAALVDLLRGDPRAMPEPWPGLLVDYTPEHRDRRRGVILDATLVRGVWRVNLSDTVYPWAFGLPPHTEETRCTFDEIRDHAGRILWRARDAG